VSPWPPRRSTGGDAALWAAGAVGLLALLALLAAAVQEPGFGMLLWAAAAVPLVAVAAGLAVWALSYRQLLYTLGDRELRIQWLGRCFCVPFASIEGIYTGQRLVGHAVPDVLSWPGIYIGPGRLRGLGRLRFFATSQDPAALTLIAFEQGGVVLSARNPHEFRLALIERVQQADEADTARPGWRREALLDAPWLAVLDRWLWLGAAAGVVLLLGMLAVIVVRFDALPSEVPLRFNAAGEPSQFAARGDLLRLPVYGLLALLVDYAVGMWVDARDCLVARILWTGGAVLELVLLVAVIRLVQ
jgi:hypothetical protein